MTDRQIGVLSRFFTKGLQTMRHDYELLTSDPNHTRKYGVGKADQTDVLVLKTTIALLQDDLTKLQLERSCRQKTT
jgi:hypothetical protein